MQDEDQDDAGDSAQGDYKNRPEVYDDVEAEEIVEQEEDAQPEQRVHDKKVQSIKDLNEHVKQDYRKQKTGQLEEERHMVFEGGRIF